MLKILIFNMLTCISLMLSPWAQVIAAEPVLRNGIYIIQMSNSDMTAAATSEAGNSPMILWPYRPTATWVFQSVGNNAYTIRTNSTLLSGGGQGASAIIARAKKSDDQKWVLKRVGGMYQIINQKTGLALTLSNANRVKGSKLRTEQITADDAQLFCIQKPSAPRHCGGSGDKEDYPDSNKKDREDNIKSYINKRGK